MKAYVQQIKSNNDRVHVYILVNKRQTLELVYLRRELVAGPKFRDIDQKYFQTQASREEYKELKVGRRIVKPLVQLAQARIDADISLKVINFVVDPEPLEAMPTHIQTGEYFLVNSALTDPKDLANMNRIIRNVVKQMV